MGGHGSGRWRNHDRNTTVQECCILSGRCLFKTPFFLTHKGERRLLYPNMLRVSIRWSAGMNYLGSPKIELRMDEGDRARIQIITLKETVTPIGPTRYWFKCPLLIDGHLCGRLTAKLYLPPAGRYFGCRNCHELTYRSCLTKPSSWLKALRAQYDRMDPEL
jgi:hypothetical protein